MSDKDYMREYMRRYSAQRRERVLTIMGGVCERCGTNDDIDVHHRDPGEKSFDLGKRWHRKWEDILQEIPKCMLLCNPCHIEHHRSDAEHGTARRYWRGCRCGPCRAANSAHNRQYRRSRG